MGRVEYRKAHFKHHGNMGCRGLSEAKTCRLARQFEECCARGRSAAQNATALRLFTRCLAQNKNCAPYNCTDS